MLYAPEVGAGATVLRRASAFELVRSRVENRAEQCQAAEMAGRGIRSGNGTMGEGVAPGSLLELMSPVREANLRAEVGAALTKAKTLREALQRVCEAVVAQLDAAFARVWTLSGPSRILELQASAGMYTHIDGGHARVPVGSFKIGLIAEERLPHLTNDVQHDPRVGDRAWAFREGLVGFAGYPLLVGDRIVGVIAAFTRQPLAQDALDLLAATADLTALAIDRAHTDEQRARLIQELAAKNAELDQFAYVASHDLKAPLRGIANLAQWVEEDLGERMTDDARENMRLLRGRVHRLENLIDGILSYSRAGREAAEVKRVDVGPLAREVVELLGVPPAATVTVAADLPTVFAQRTQLQQVFMNLIGNAIKYGGKPDVNVAIGACDKDATAWEFFVRDDGIGIAPRYHERIWGMFQTLEPRDKVEGTGIGLSVVKKVVESRGGRVRLDSNEGAGSTFYFTWPKGDVGL